VAEQFGLYQRRWQGGAVDDDERLVTARPGGVNVACDRVLADAGLAGDQHCGVDAGIPARQLEQPA
jgi:hypothetical protein